MPKPPRAVSYAVAQRLDDLSPATWHRLTASAGVFMQRPFLEAFEVARPRNVEPRYAVLSYQGQPTAAVVMQLARLEGRVAVRADAPLAGVAQVVDERLLVLGNLAAWGQTGLALAPDATVDAATIWRDALGLLDRVRRFERVEGAVNVSLVKDAAELEPDGLLKAAGYARPPSGPDMVLELTPWKDYEQYLASLAAKRRRAVKKTREDVETAGYALTELTVDQLAGYEARLDELYGSVWDNAEVRPLRLSGGFFVELKRRLGDDCSVRGLVRAGRLDGFGVTLRSQETCVGYYLGYDPTVDAPLYFRLLSNIIEQGFRWGSALVSLGRTTEDTKARLGAVPGNRGLWLKHRTPPFNWAVGTLLSTLPPPRAPEHRAFKAVERHS